VRSSRLPEQAGSTRLPGDMKSRIDIRLAGIAGATLLVVCAAAWAGVILFRYWFPVLAAKTILDELSGVPVAALAAVIVKRLLFREEIFHLMVTADVLGHPPVDVYLLRRRKGARMLFVPAFHREAIIAGQNAMIRNIAWWGISAIDVCTLCFKFGDADGRYLRIPGTLLRHYATVRVRLSELSNGRPLTVSREHVD